MIHFIKMSSFFIVLYLSLCSLVTAREKHLFPPKFYESCSKDKLKYPKILESHPDDIYWTDISSQSGGLIDYPYLMKVCNNALYVMGEEASTGYGVIGRYTKKDGWKIVCELDVNGSIWDFSVDSNDIYLGGGFATAGPKQVPAVNIVRFNILTKAWYPMGDGLWDPNHTNVSNMVSQIDAYKGLVFIGGGFTHTGSKRLPSYDILWNGKEFVDNYEFSFITPIYHDGLLYSVNCGINPYLNNPNIMTLYVGEWDGKYSAEESTKQYPWNIKTIGVNGGMGFGMDSKKNYYFVDNYDYKSPADSTKHEYGTYFLGFIDSTWKLLGGDKWAFTGMYTGVPNSAANNDVVREVDDKGQVYVAGYFRKGIGGDTSFRKKSIIMWDGIEWNTMGNGIDGYASCITHYDGEVYIGGGFGEAGDKLTNGFAKWDNKIDSIIEEQPIILTEISIYPNPTSSYFTITGIDSVKSLRLMNSIGMEVMNHKVVNGEATVDIRNLAIGVYFIQFLSQTGFVSKPIVICY